METLSFLTIMLSIIVLLKKYLYSSTEYIPTGTQIRPLAIYWQPKISKYGKERQDVKDFLLTNWNGNCLKRGASQDPIVKFSVTASCVSKIWRQMIAEHL
jgi:hypothetical protein